MGEVEGWRDAWVAALDELEIDVAQAEAMLEHDHSRPTEIDFGLWTPPPVDGPMPEDLVPQAVALFDRQQRVASRLARAAVQTRQQAEVAARMADDGHRAGVAYFLDAQA